MRVSPLVIYAKGGHEGTWAAGSSARSGIGRESYRRKATACQMADQIPSDNVSVRQELPAEVKSKLKAALLKIARSDDGRRILENYDIDGLEPVKDSDYDSIRKATEALDINLEQAIQPKKK